MTPRLGRWLLGRDPTRPGRPTPEICPTAAAGRCRCLIRTYLTAQAKQRRGDLTSSDVYGRDNWAAHAAGRRLTKGNFSPPEARCDLICSACLLARRWLRSARCTLTLPEADRPDRYGGSRRHSVRATAGLNPKKTRKANPRTGLLDLRDRRSRCRLSLAALWRRRRRRRRRRRNRTGVGRQDHRAVRARLRRGRRRRRRRGRRRRRRRRRRAAKL